MIENPERNLNVFIDQIIELLKEVERAGLVLFSIQFRSDYKESIEEVITQLNISKDHSEIYNPDDFPSMNEAGLTGSQLTLKLNSFESSLRELHFLGGIDNLSHSLDKGSVILGSLAGVIPGFGSFAQELIDFILKELKKRAKFWKTFNNG